jgi:C7-cyclitol 7-kinase
VTAVAVDLGGTFLRCAIATGQGHVTDVVSRRIDRDPKRHNSEEIWSRLFDAIEEYAGGTHAGLSREDPIAFAFPGPIVDHARIIGAPTVAGKNTAMPDVVNELHERTGRAVYLLNDLSAAAWYYLDAVPDNRFMVVTVSSGIGSKLVDRAHPDRVLDGRAGAGEIGHIVVDSRPEAPVCDCGGRGHLGAISSGRGTEDLARRMSRLDSAAFAQSRCVTEFGATNDDLTNEAHLVPAALAGDVWAWSVIRKAQEPLALVLATAIVAASLDRVLVIGGFAATLGERYIRSLCDAVQARTSSGLIDIRIDDVISFGRSASEACLRGAGLFAASIAHPDR